MKALRYFGKICEKHPELKGERRKANRKCVKCAQLRANSWAKENKEKMRAHNKACYEKHRNERREYKKKNAHILKEWTVKNKDKIKIYGKRYRERHREKWLSNGRRSWVMRYALIGGQALAKKFSREIKIIYDKCPIGFEVDHIIPLRGDSVNGLHVPWNLQYLPALENRSKGNKYVR